MRDFLPPYLYTAILEESRCIAVVEMSVHLSVMCVYRLSCTVSRNKSVFVLLQVYVINEIIVYCWLVIVTVDYTLQIRTENYGRCWFHEVSLPWEADKSSLENMLYKAVNRYYF